MSDALNRPLHVTEESTTLRSRFGRVLVVAVWVVLAVCLVSLFFPPDLLQLARYVPVLLLGAYVVWLLMWSPSVTISPSGVTIRNLLRVRVVSWPAIERIDTRFALTLYTVTGRVTAWSAPAPSRFAAMRSTRSELSNLPESTYAGGGIRPGDIPQSDSGLAALYVRRYWEQLRDAGYLDSGVVDGSGVVTSWLRREVIVLVVLAVVSLGTILLVPGS